MPCRSSSTSSGAACRADCSSPSGRSGAWPTRCTPTGSASEGAGALAVYAGTSPANTSEVLDLISAEIDRMVTKTA